jgi:hypothetical protein
VTSLRALPVDINNSMNEREHSSELSLSGWRHRDGC